MEQNYKVSEWKKREQKEFMKEAIQTTVGIVSLIVIGYILLVTLAGIN